MPASQWQCVCGAEWRRPFNDSSGIGQQECKDAVWCTECHSARLNGALIGNPASQHIPHDTQCVEVGSTGAQGMFPTLYQGPLPPGPSPVQLLLFSLMPWDALQTAYFLLQEKQQQDLTVLVTSRCHHVRLSWQSQCHNVTCHNDIHGIVRVILTRNFNRADAVSMENGFSTDQSKASAT